MNNPLLYPLLELINSGYQYFGEQPIAEITVNNKSFDRTADELRDKTIFYQEIPTKDEEQIQMTTYAGLVTLKRKDPYQTREIPGFTVDKQDIEAFWRLRQAQICEWLASLPLAERAKIVRKGLNSLPKDKQP